MAPLLSSDLRLTRPRYVWLHIVHIYLVLVLVTVQYSTVQYSVSAGECAESCSASAQSAGIFIMIEKSYTSNFTLKSLSAQHSFY